MVTESVIRRPSTQVYVVVAYYARTTTAEHDIIKSTFADSRRFRWRFRGGRKIKKFVEESRLIPVAFMVMPGCVYSTIQFIFFSLRLISFATKLSILRISFRTVLYTDSTFPNKVRVRPKISQITAVDWLCSRLQRSFLLDIFVYKFTRMLRADS